MNQLLIKKRDEKLKKKKKGFTLVELIIVIAVIGILAAIAVPKFGQIRENANEKADLATAKNIQTAVLTGISNGNIEIPAITEQLEEGKLQAVIEGGVIPQPKAKDTKDGNFSAIIKSDGSVIVTVGTNQILPEKNSTSTEDSESELEE